MTSKSFRKLLTEFQVNFDWNPKFQEYVKKNYKPSVFDYDMPVYSTDDMLVSRAFWKQNAKRHQNYPWFKDNAEAYEWIDKMPFGGYEY